MKQKGQTLVEAIVIVGMVMLMVTGLISGTTASLKSSLSTKARGEATKYAEEGMELIRIQRDKNWTTVSSYMSGTGYHCFGGDGTIGPAAAIDSCTTNITTSNIQLTRTALFTAKDANTIHVNVTVSFAEGDITRSVPLDTYLTEWR